MGQNILSLLEAYLPGGIAFVAFIFRTWISNLEDSAWHLRRFCRMIQ
jgi:hypothetical protein